jgi:hypothetical protein
MFFFTEYNKIIPNEANTRKKKMKIITLDEIGTTTSL